MIKSVTEKVILKIIHCPVCDKYYEIRNFGQVSCLVNHPEGSCCHYADREMTKAEVDKIIEEMKRSE